MQSSPGDDSVHSPPPNDLLSEDTNLGIDNNPNTPASGDSHQGTPVVRMLPTVYIPKLNVKTQGDMHNGEHVQSPKSLPAQLPPSRPKRNIALVDYSEGEVSDFDLDDPKEGPETPNMTSQKVRV